MTLLYELLILFGWLIYTPSLLFQKWIKKKQIPTVLDRIGMPLPNRQKEKTYFWIHAVSLGETKAAKVLCKKFKSKYPDCAIFFTTSTWTGKKEALSIPEIDEVRYLPLDFRLIQRLWVKRLKPKLLLFIEGDIWPNLIKEAKKNGVETFLVSGKISETSFRRLSKIPFIARLLYSKIDHLLLQNIEYKLRIQKLIDHPSIHITGNIKLATEIEQKKPLNTHQNRPILTISCTHAPEEKELLIPLLSLPVFILLAPRHPERFDSIAIFLEEQKIPFYRYTQKDQKKGDEKVLLFDVMGKLPEAYAASFAVILGGSFSSKIGGHNPLEPLYYGAPVIFGPYMHLQKELAKLALDTSYAYQATIEELPSILLKLLQTPKENIAHSFQELGKNVIDCTWSKIKDLEQNT